MKARLQAIAAERAQLQAQIAAGRARLGQAVVASGREALVAVAVAGASRWLSRRFRFGPVAAVVLGLIATRLSARRTR
ncbi:MULTISPECIES: hypothetical protein [Ramlibacter]|uniref:DUF3618 domain-containing protein n=1 Tax=Ramlibacter aquaticus TaxID=2780094 RepID=A0ABR9SE67_9BURK|nr:MULTISPECIES: hypothetical protein [Ramlibacter]MBE7940646.1 hypothetical protein [Ramlibacter aquaticus]